MNHSRKENGASCLISIKIDSNDFYVITFVGIKEAFGSIRKSDFNIFDYLWFFFFLNLASCSSKEKGGNKNANRNEGKRNLINFSQKSVVAYYQVYPLDPRNKKKKEKEKRKELS